MDIIENMDPVAFSEYLKKYQNTICGRHPIGVLLNVSWNCFNYALHNWVLKTERKEQNIKIKMKFQGIRLTLLPQITKGDEKRNDHIYPLSLFLIFPGCCHTEASQWTQDYHEIY